MRSHQDVKELIEHIKSDSRYPKNISEYADVFSNAPLALIQAELVARVDVLRWVLDELDHGGGSAGFP